MSRISTAALSLAFALAAGSALADDMGKKDSMGMKQDSMGTKKDSMAKKKPMMKKKDAMQKDGMDKDRMQK